MQLVTCKLPKCIVSILPVTNSLESTEFAAIFADVTALSATALAVPVRLPVTLPSIFAINVPVVIDKSPVEAPVNVPVPILNLSSLSSNPIKILFELPLSPTIPISPEGEPDVPFASSINLSEITVFVDAAVVVVPLTVKLPDSVTLPVNV